MHISGEVKLKKALTQHPTFLISGTAAGVTRNQDIFTRDGISSLINSTEGVLFVEAKATFENGAV